MFTNDQNTKDLMQTIFDSKGPCDVILVSRIDNQKFPAHCVVLTASSKYFAARLGPNFRERTEEEIFFDDISGLSLKSILHYIYTGVIEITAENVVDIVAAASHMELIALEDKCVKFWYANMSIENCVEIFLNADRYHFKDLWSKALKFICENFEAVPIDDVQQIDKKNFQEVLKHDKITAAETVVFDRLFEWMKENQFEAGEVASKMFQLIRLDHIPIQFLTETIKPFFEKYECEKMLCHEYRMRSLNSKIICLHRFYAQINCSFGNPSDDGIEILKYNATENDWSEYKSISFDAKREDFGSIFVNGELFVMGGQYMCGTCSNSVESYNLDNLTRTKLPSMSSKRSLFTPISIGKYIYVFGGFNESVIDACERFDTDDRVWQTRQKMPIPMCDFAIEEFNGQLYILSNFPGSSSRVLYRYCPDTDVWMEKSRDRCVSGLFKTNHFLYGGGTFDTLRYEPERDVWIKIRSFSIEFEIKRTLNFDGQVYAVCWDGKFGILKMENRSDAFIPLKALPSKHYTFTLFSN